MSRSIAWCRPKTFVVIAGLSLLVSGTAGTFVQSRDLLGQAKKSRVRAEKVALSRVPGGIIKAVALEKGHGKIYWTVDIAQPSSVQLTTVRVDALSGEFISQVTGAATDQVQQAR